MKSYERLEKILSGYTLTFDRTGRDDRVEWSAFPPLVEIYWRMVRDGVPPMQQEFVERVRGEAAHLPEAGVRYRAQRAYPSLVREHHASLVLGDAFRWVFKSIRADYDGVDVIIIGDQGQTIGLALSTNTSNSHFWREVKATRHRFPLPVPVLTILCDETYQVGPFWLHKPSDLVEQVTAFLRGNGRDGATE